MFFEKIFSINNGEIIFAEGSEILLYVIFFVIFCFLLRCAFYRYVIFDSKERSKKVLQIIGISFVMSIVADVAFVYETSKEVSAVAYVILIGYLFMNFAERCSKGYTESLLLVVNSTFVLLLSYTALPWNIVFAILTCEIARIIYKKLESELKSDLWEIRILCAEAVILSIIVWFNKWDGIGFKFIYTVLCETILFIFNVFLKLGIKKYLGEDTEFYFYDMYQ